MPSSLPITGLRISDVIRQNLGGSLDAYNALVPGQMLRIGGAQFNAIRAALAGATVAATTDATYTAVSTYGYAVPAMTVAQGGHSSTPAFIAGHYPVLLRMRHDNAVNAVNQPLQIGASATGGGTGVALTAANTVTVSISSQGTDSFWVVRSPTTPVPAGALFPRVRTFASMMYATTGATTWYGTPADVTGTLGATVPWAGGWQIITTPTIQWRP